MSRVGKQKLTIPANTTVTVADGLVTVKGPLGELSRSFPATITVSVEGSEVTFTPKNESNELYAIWGTCASHVKNMIEGVNKPYEKKLIIEGVGYRVEMKGTALVMQLGFSHPVTIDIPKGITASVEKNTIMISGIDKELVGQFAALVRDQKKPEPYKGKGIMYAGETIRRKEGKRAA